MRFAKKKPKVLYMHNVTQSMLIAQSLHMLFFVSWSLIPPESLTDIEKCRSAWEILSRGKLALHYISNQDFI